MNIEVYNIAVIGGGASGMAAAIAAARENPEASVAIIEKNKKLGKKLYATGNGRCNLSNTSCPDFTEIDAFFESLGVVLREEEEGRVYPFNGSAAAVVQALEREMERLGIAVLTDVGVGRIEQVDKNSIDVEGRHGDNKKSIENRESDKLNSLVYYEKTPKSTNNTLAEYFVIHTDRGILAAEKLIISTGGKAGAEFGSTGDGYAFVKSFGHSVSTPFPVLTPVECYGDFSEIKGARAKGLVKLHRFDKIIAEEYGEVQFTEYGLSGICIMNLSRYLRRDENAGEYGFGNYFVTIDLLPEGRFKELNAVAKSQSDTNLKNSTDNEKNQPEKRDHKKLRELLKRNPKAAASILPEKMYKRYASFAEMDDGEAMYEIIRGGQNFGVLRPRGWKQAQCTGGGVPLSEVDQNTMESKFCPGLYLTGELLDYDGPCGGFNLSHAWISGIRAGRAAAISLN